MTTLPLPDSQIDYYPDFLSSVQAHHFFEVFKESLKWEQGFIQLFGIKPEPRLSCWYGDSEAVYTYSQKKMFPLPWTTELLELKHEIESQTGQQFNSVLCNLYRDGNDSMGWHSDNEPELGLNPVIASVSLGQVRKFRFKHKSLKRNTHSLSLESGSLLLMSGSTQEYWLHEIPKEPKILGARINLTFRFIIPKTK
ncbi:MAG: alpha-ketoglutarate-dependent dioxygenase AlkB [Cytophagales bacterium]